MDIKLFESSYRLLNKYAQKTQKAKHYGTDDLLYAAEVHMIDTIGSHKKITVTELAQILGITKGAVSQTANKLSEKGLIEKHTSSERKNVVGITLSPKGQTVFDFHRDMHRNAQDRIGKALEKLPPESLTAIESVISILDEMLDEMQ